MSMYHYPPAYLNPRPGEVRYKEWLGDMATRIGITPTGVAMRIARGTIKVKVRRVNPKVVFVVKT